VYLGLFAFCGGDHFFRARNAWFFRRFTLSDGVAFGICTRPFSPPVRGGDSGFGSDLGGPWSGAIYLPAEMPKPALFVSGTSAGS
jgi:hypothetical protein